MTAPRRFPWSVLTRSLAIQGSWSYETLAGTGFGFAILPELRELYRDPAALDAAIRRHEGPFNAHPYLAPLALGAVIRLEQDGEDPAVIERFKAALRGSLGTLGDQLVWAGWRPVCVLAALGLMLAGVAWYLVLVLFLLFYNIGHLALMVWGLSVGLRDGRFVADRLRGSIVRHTQPRIMAVGAFLAAFVTTLLVVVGLPHVGVDGGWGWGVAAVAGAVVGISWGDRARRLATVAVLIFAAGGIAVGVFA